MAKLNPLFAARCADVCEAFLAYETDLPREWIRAFSSYLDKESSIWTLALMAKAHILFDLPEILYELEIEEGTQINQDEYESVLTIILQCMKNLAADIFPGHNLEDMVLRYAAEHLGLFGSVGRFQIYQLRAEAWSAYKLKRDFRLKQLRRKVGRDI